MTLLSLERCGVVAGHARLHRTLQFSEGGRRVSEQAGVLIPVQELLGCQLAHDDLVIHLNEQYRSCLDDCASGIG